MARFALPTTSSMWEANVNFVSRTTPKSRITDTRSRVLLLMEYDVMIGFLRRVKVMTLHFAGLSFKPRLDEQQFQQQPVGPHHPTGVRLAISQGTPGIGETADYSILLITRDNEIFRAEDPSPVTHAFSTRTLRKCRDLSQHTATSILFIGNIANVNATPSHKWFHCEFTY